MVDFNVEIKLFNEICKYCELNDIDNVNKFINDLIIKGFALEKYGDKPEFINDEKENVEIKEVKKEKNIYTITHDLPKNVGKIEKNNYKIELDNTPIKEDKNDEDDLYNEFDGSWGSNLLD